VKIVAVKAILSFRGVDELLPAFAMFIYVCNKNQQNAHFFINDLIQLYCLRHLIYLFCLFGIYLVSDLCGKFSIRYPHIVLLNIREFHENWRREGRTFLGTVNEIIRIFVPWNRVIF
jgi:surface polysaccharide O-acyltransferase-like enzyme